MKRELEFVAFQILKSIFFFLPRSWCLALGKAAGTLAYRFDKRHRNLALHNLGIAFRKGLPSLEIRKIARSSFRHFGGVMADVLKLSFYRKSQIKALLTVEGEDNFRRALGLGRGVLIVTGHLGNWEVASSWISDFGKLNVIARPLDNTLLERQIFRFRSCLGANVIDKFHAAKQTLQALRADEIVAILIDQNVLRSQAVFVDFFGRPAATTPALAAFFLRTESPIVPMFCHPAPDNTYLLRIYPALDISSEGDLETNLLKITQICTKMIEQEIRSNPGIWLWFHNRWKSRPEGENEN
jgi:KDO2-lipid IV(A) lauroyltransferase